MKAAGAMAAASVAGWLAATAVFGPAHALEIQCGLIGPLVAVSASWIATERAFRRHPERLTALMVGSFGAKLIFFGAYVAIGVRLWSLRPVPFVVSFTGYFIGLYAVEAVLLQRLFAEK